MTHVDDHDPRFAAEALALSTGERFVLRVWSEDAAPAVDTDALTASLLLALALETPDEGLSSAFTSWEHGVDTIVQGHDAHQAIVSAMESAVREEAQLESALGGLFQCWAQSPVVSDSLQPVEELVLALSLEHEALAPQVSQAITQWADTAVPALDSAQLDALVAAVFAENTPALRASEPIVQSARVIPLRRRWVAPAAVSSLIAAAAAAVFMVIPTQPPTQPPPTRTPAAAQVLPSVPTAPPSVALPTTTTLGSEVESVEVEGDQTSFMVLSLPGIESGSAVAVVWIEDNRKTNPVR
ncbi:MAG: hypothetical protein Q8Q09_24200 [Deltaproteobacteria bacterium]|nr:hypothetical protein [Deltaproteobacteria bacterium]